MNIKSIIERLIFGPEPPPVPVESTTQWKTTFTEQFEEHRGQPAEFAPTGSTYQFPITSNQ